MILANKKLLMVIFGIIIIGLSLQNINEITPKILGVLIGGYLIYKSGIRL